MTNVSNLQTQLASIMELLTKAAISEIIKVFDDSYTVLRLEISQNQNEKEALKRKLQEVQEQLTCVRMRLETGLPPSNCPPHTNHEDWTSSFKGGEAVTEGICPEEQLTSEHQQSFREEPCLVRIKEERPEDDLWNQETESVRYDITVAGNSRVSQQLSQEPVEFGPLRLKVEQEEELTHSCAGDQDWNLIPEEEGNADDSFPPLLPRIELAIDYFHSNPISPEHHAPAATSHTPPPLPGTSAEAGNAFLGTDICVAPPQGRRTRKKPIICPVCNKQLQAPSELVKHMRTHTGEGPYTCGICGMHFTQKSRLNTHERLHSIPSFPRRGKPSKKARLGPEKVVNTSEEEMVEEEETVQVEEEETARTKGRRVPGAATYKTSFNGEWTSKWPFITLGTTSSYYWCSICRQENSCTHQGVRDVTRHIGSKRHQDKQRALKSTSTVENFNSPVTAEMSVQEVEEHLNA